jgi:amidase
MAFADYAEHDGLGLAALVKSKKASPAEILEAAIERIEKHNGVLNAVVHKEYDEARKTAAGDLPEGPFKGVPFLIKDLGAQVKGWPRTSGSMFAQVAADEDDRRPGVHPHPGRLLRPCRHEDDPRPQSQRRRGL